MDEKDIGRLIKSLNDKLKASADASLKELGLTFSQTLVIEFVCSRGGRATQKEIEEHLQVSHPTVVGIVSRLEKSGFITCFTDERDRRNKVVCAADKALDMLNVIRSGTRETEKRLTEGLSDKELKKLRSMLDRLYKNL